MNQTVAVFREFLLLGFTAFGGPTAHVAFFRERFVASKSWLTEAEFADLLALCQFLPGPASSQLGLSIGWKRAGWPGAFAAWFAFTTPSAIALTLFAIGVMAFGGRMDSEAGWLRGLQIAVVAVIANAVGSMWSVLCPNVQTRLIALASAAVILGTSASWMQLVVIGAGALAGLLLLSPEPAALVAPPRGNVSATPSKASLSQPQPRGNSGTVGAFCLILFASFLVALPLAAKTWPNHAALDLFNAMYRSGSFVFGGGHVVLPLLSQETVGPGWVSAEEFLAGYGAAQAVPGPLFTFSSYLGALVQGPGGPFAMSAVGLVGIFLPAWLLVLGVMPFWHRLVAQAGIRAALAGTNAAVVGLLGAALYSPVWIGAIQSRGDVVFLIGVAAALLVLKLPPWAVVIAAGWVGWLLG